MKLEKKLFIVIDANSIIHRAFHALPPLTNKKGELVNAVYGFLLVFLKIIKELKPDFIVAAFDSRGSTFRHHKYKEYKAKRPPAPESLYRQIPKIKKILKKFNIPIFEKEGFEADDIVGTIVNLVPKKQIFPKIENIILSGDSDTFQLVNDFTKVYSLKRGVKDTVLYDEKLVKEKYQGLSPEQLLDFKALRGDPSDNIPGVSGIGEKTAIELLSKFKSLENIFREIEEKTEKSNDLSSKIKEKLLKYKEQAFISKDLAKIEENVPIDFNLESCRWGNYNKEKIIETFKEFQFYSLINRLPEKKNMLK